MAGDAVDHPAVVLRAVMRPEEAADDEAETRSPKLRQVLE